MKKSNMEIPHDLIISHILPKLPVKPLIRFKCVSKSWFSPISNPQFAKLYSSSSSHHQFLLFSGNLPNHPLFTSVTMDEHGRVEDITKLGFTHQGGPIHVVGCDNGLVCFMDKNAEFTICNPVTCKCNEIPPISDVPHFGSNIVLSSGFGYVASVDDYMIACLTRNFQYIIDNNQYLANVYVFSLRTWEWRELPKVDNVTNRVMINRTDVPALVDDTLYWCAHSPPNVSVVVGVNLVNGELRTIPFVGGCIYREVKLLFRIKGRLTVWCCVHQRWVGKDGCFQGIVGILNDGDGDLLWTKLYDFDWMRMRLLCVSEMSGIWLLMYRGSLVLLDPGENVPRYRQGAPQFKGPIASAWDFRMSLVSPTVVSF